MEGSVLERGRVGRALVAFGAGWWLAAAVATLGILVAVALDARTAIPLAELPVVPLVSAVAPGVVPVILAWDVGIGTGLVVLPPECGGSTAGDCHGIGWGIAAAGVIAGVALLGVAWLALPLGLFLDARRGDGPGLSRAGWVVSLVPYAAGVVGLSYLARRYRPARGRRGGWLLAVGTAVAAYLAVAGATFVLALAGATGI